MRRLGYFLLLSIFLYTSCSKPANNSVFIEQNTGRFLYNSDEVVEVYFEEGILLLNWRGAERIKPMKIDDTTFYIKEMNEKIQFLTNPEDGKQYMVLVPKNEEDTLVFNFRKLEDKEKIPEEFLEEQNYEAAMKGYLDIQQKDSLDSAINERDFNSLGYSALRENNYEKAIEIFKINVALYPDSPNVYDSLGEAYFNSGDTISSIANYKRSLELDSGNRRAKERLEEMKSKK
jgi:tetratricopeptide (TPR) repeat protein